MLNRVLEPEVMDSADEACDYNAMDHREVNRLFVDDFLAAGPIAGEILDVGTGTAQIPLELCQRTEEVRVMAIDLAVSMLHLAIINIDIATMRDRIMLDRIDAKSLPYDDGRFAAVISNSIVHHIPEPFAVLSEAMRVVSPGGRLMFRDLVRPDDEQTLAALVDRYATEANEHQRKMFGESLHAALRLEEIRELVARLGIDPQTVNLTSDRHWTWLWTKPDA